MHEMATQAVAIATQAASASFDAESYLTTIAIWATEGVLGLTAMGLLYLWQAHYKFREHVANTYVKNDDLVHKIDKVELDIGEMRKMQERILVLIGQLRGGRNGNLG
mgnify:CR=1 FL=1